MQAEANKLEYLGRDIALDETDDVAIGIMDDFRITKWYDNLKQSMINRLRTAKGEIALNPDYGSRLGEIIGTNPNDETLLLAKAYTKEALLQEPRIQEILIVSARYPDVIKNVIEVSVRVMPIKVTEPLNMVFRLFIEGTIVGGPN